MRQISPWAAFLIYFACLGCSNANPVSAAYCATVSAYHTDDRRNEIKLTSLFALFAQNHGLHLNGTEGIDTNEYTDDSQSLVLDVTFGMGEFGSVITLFYRGHVGDKIKNDLDNFVMSQINPIFKVRKCSDIPGFQNPTMSNEFR